jgi:hypothetical protein
MGDRTRLNNAIGFQYACKHIESQTLNAIDFQYACKQDGTHLSVPSNLQLYSICQLFIQSYLQDACVMGYQPTILHSCG